MTAECELTAPVTIGGAEGTLITINNKIRGKDGQLRLANIDRQIYEVFVITKLNKLFQIHDATDQALASFT